MGYSTDFTGGFKMETTPTVEQIAYLNTFSSTRRMKRNVDELNRLYEGKYGLNCEYGVDGEYFAKDDGEYGQSRDSSVIEYNQPPSTQPGLWCQWVIKGSELIWDGGEKFYHYTEWLKYLIDNFFNAWGIKLNGIVDWEGEDRGDHGTITVVNNKVTIKDN